MASHFAPSDWKAAASLAAESRTAYVQCSETNEAGSQCVYGEGHSIETHLFADGGRS